MDTIPTFRREGSHLKLFYLMSRFTSQMRQTQSEQKKQQHTLL